MIRFEKLFVYLCCKIGKFLLLLFKLEIELKYVFKSLILLLFENVNLLVLLLFV